MELIGEFFLAPGYSTELMRVFLARDLRPDPLLNADLEALDSFSHYNFAWKPDSSQLAYVRSNQVYSSTRPSCGWWMPMASTACNWWWQDTRRSG